MSGLTVRQHAEAILRGRYETGEFHPWADEEFTAADYRKHAVAILRALKEAERLVPDPRPAGDICDCADFPEHHYRQDTCPPHRIVEDG